MSDGSGKLRVAAIIVLGIAAIVVLATGRREPECGRLSVREDLVRQIGERLYENLGPGQAYELAWRSDFLVVRAVEADGAHLCRAGFDYVGPDDSGLLAVDYTVTDPRRRGRTRLTDMRLTRSPGFESAEADKSSPGGFNF